MAVLTAAKVQVAIIDLKLWFFWTEDPAKLGHGHLYYWTAMSSFIFLASGQHEAGTWDQNYTPGVDFLDHRFL